MVGERFFFWLAGRGGKYLALAWAVLIVVAVVEYEGR